MKIEELNVQCHELEIQTVMIIIFISYMERLCSSFQLQAVYEHFEVNIYLFRIEF